MCAEQKRVIFFRYTKSTEVSQNWQLATWKYSLKILTPGFSA